MHSTTNIQEGPLIFHDMKNGPKKNYFQLFKDHIIKYDDVELFQSNPELAIQSARVMPITLARVTLYEFYNEQMHHTLVINFQQVTILISPPLSLRPKIRKKCFFGMRNSDWSPSKPTLKKITKLSTKLDQELLLVSTRESDSQTRRNLPSRSLTRVRLTITPSPTSTRYLFK